MDIIVFRSHELPIVLGTLRTLVARPSARQLRYLGAIARLHGCNLDPSMVTTVPVPLTAAAIQDPHRRKRLVQLAVIMTMVDGKVLVRPARAVAALAEALEVEEPAVRTLPLLVSEKPLRTRANLMRRVLGKFLSEAWRDQGFAGVHQVIAGFLGRGGDRATALRYAQLEHFPHGSLGRTLWQHCTLRKFALPGQPGAIPERVLFHDIGHVLSGYDTDPAGEIRQAAFQAGFVRKDGFMFLFFGVIQFHMGVKITPVAEAEHGFFDVEAVLTALARGAACAVDLSDRWDLWAAAAQPLEQVRAEYCVPPLVAAASAAA